LINNSTILEDSGITNYELNVTDIEGNDLNLTVESNNTNILTVTTGWVNLLSQGYYDGKPLDFNLTTVKDAYGIVRITIKANDGIDATTRTFDINVTNVNDAPIIGTLIDRTLIQGFDEENISIPLTDVDPTDILQYNITADRNDIITATLLNNIITIEEITNQVGKTELNISINDGTVTVYKEISVRVVRELDSTNPDADIEYTYEGEDNETEVMTLTEEDDNLTVVTKQKENGPASHTLSVDDMNLSASSDLNGSIVEIVDNGVKTSYEGTDINATAESKIEGVTIHTLKVNGKTIQATSYARQSQTTISKDTNGSVIVTTNSQIGDTNVTVVAKEDGTAEHTLKNSAGVESKATAKINGAKTVVDTEGNVETKAGDTAGTPPYILRAIAITQPNGKTITKFIWENANDESDTILIGNTMTPDTPYEAGTKVIIDTVDSKLFIKTTAPLNDDLTTANEGE
jgi:hypothetical protein